MLFRSDSEQVAKLMNGEKADMGFFDPPFDFDFDFDFDLINGHIFFMTSEKKLIVFASKHINNFSRLYAIDFRNAHLISNNCPMTRVDFIAEFLNGKSKFNNLKDGFSTLIESSKGVFQKEQLIKQAKKPELSAIFIRHYTKQNDIVLDMFGGSGSTMVASEQLNRKCYMIEKNPNHCQIILDRMKKSCNLDHEKIN